MSGYKITNTDGIILNSDGKGLSIPTVNSITNAPTNVPEGSIIYAIDNKQIYRFNGTSWLVSAGTSGTSGNTGNAGSSGTSGSTGTSGSSGNSGTDGSSGSSGSTGTSGSSGSTGSSGSSGSTGSAGTSGTSGSSGSSGTTGTSGNTGSSGSSGSSGSTGTSGSSGSSGTSGQSVPGGLSILYSGTDLSSTSFVTGRITYSLSSLGSNNGDLRISGVDGNGNTIQNGSTATLLDQLISKGATGSDGHILTISERGNSAKINYYSYSTLAKATTPTNTDAVFTGLDYIGGSGESTFAQPVISLTMVGAAGTSGAAGAQGVGGTAGTSGISLANARAANSYVATDGQTTFSLTYTVGQVEVFNNGLKLSDGDFDATNGTSVILDSPLAAGDIVDIVAYTTGGGIAYSGLSASTPLTYNAQTGAFGITQAGDGTSGFLSASDWTAFNAKNATGAQGAAGTAGSSGSSGSSGTSGAIGAQGAVGSSGTSGAGTISNGTSGYVTKFTGSTALTSSGIYEGILGYISIGNTSTTYNLDVTGTGRFSGTLNGTTATFSTSVVSSDYRYAGNGYLTYNVDNIGTNTFTLRNFSTSVLSFNASNIATFSNSVGVGGSDPIYSTLESSSSTFGSAVALLSLAVKDGTYNPRSIISYVTQTGSPYYVKFSSTYSSGWGATNWVFADGNMGVGVTTPSYKLSVNGIGSFAGSGTVTGTVFIQAGHQWSLNADQSGGGSPAFSGSGFYIKNENTSTIALGFNTGGAATFASSITSTGTLSITSGSGNTVTARFKGDEAFDGANRVYITNNAYIYGRNNLVLTGRLDASNDGYSFGTNSRNSIVFNANEGGAQGAVGTEYIGFQLQLNTKALYIQTKDNNDNSRIGTTFTQSGLVGFGTTDPTQKVHVNGYIRTNGVSVFKNGGSISGFIGHEQDWLGTGSSNSLICAAEGGNSFKVFTDGTTAERIVATSTGYVHLGKGWGATNHRINLEVGQGNNILVVSAYSGANNDSVIIKAASGANPNATTTVMEVTTNSSTGRSISSGGTINASGSDYAEYIEKDVTDIIAKGDIVGINSNAKLTNMFADAISFTVKSTDPSYVGGDAWGNIVGKRPERITDQTEEEFAPILAEFESRLEEARITVDRIAFSGQVPCNVYNANVGDYIVPIAAEDGKITGQAITNPSFDQYKISVGKVWKIMEDGRAWIAVKIG